MDNMINMNDEFHTNVKKYIKKFSTEDLMNWRNKLMELGMLDNDMLHLFNEELLNRACERIIENTKKMK